MTSCACCPHHCPRPAPPGAPACRVCGEALTGQKRTLCGRLSCSNEKRRAHQTHRVHLPGLPGATKCGLELPESSIRLDAAQVDCQLCLRKAGNSRTGERTHWGKPGAAYSACGLSLPTVSTVQGFEVPSCRSCWRRWRVAVSLNRAW
jgi:hypothetical protein